MTVVQLYIWDSAVGCQLVGGGSNSETAGEVPYNDISTVRRMSLQPVPVNPTSRNDCQLKQTPSPLHPPLNNPTYLIQSWKKATRGRGRCWGPKKAWKAYRKLTDCQPHPLAHSAHNMTLGKSLPTLYMTHSSTRFYSRKDQDVHFDQDIWNVVYNVQACTEKTGQDQIM